MHIGDLRVALRSLIRNKGFALASALTLALGIAATTTIFSVVYGVLLRPLPYIDPEALVVIQGEKDYSTGPRLMNFSAPEVEEFTAATRVFARIAASAGTAFTMRDAAGPASVSAALVSADFFATLGTRPLLGRTFADTSAPEIVIGERLWRRHFGGAADVIGKSLALVDRTFTERSYTVVGVMPGQFQYPRPTTSAWLPLGFARTTGDKQVHNRNSGGYFFIARLGAGMTVADARYDAARANQVLLPHFNAARRDMRATVTALDDFARGRIGPALWLLFGAVSLVMLVACANVANLILARQLSRTREVAMHLALGAPRARLLVFLLSESMVIAGLGLAFGVAASFAAIRALQWLQPIALPRLDAVAVDLPVLAFATAIALLASLASGLGPALIATRTDTDIALKAGLRPAGSAVARRIRSTLVIVQIAASIVLLVGASLLTRTVVALVNTDLGVTTNNVMTALLDLGPGRRLSSGQQVEIAQALRERIAALPSVLAVGFGTGLPPDNEYVRASLVLPNPSGAGATSHMVTVVPVGAGYFEALQIRVLKGRLFSDADLAATTGAVIIDREAARRFYGDADPVGRTLPFDKSLLTVVGVVENVRYAGLTGPREATIYRPFEQSPICLLNLVARTADNASQVAADMRQIVRDYDPDIGIVSIQRMTDWVTQAVAEPRGRALLVSVIAGMTLVLAVIGLYGVVAYATLQRVREIGVRMALGASRRDVVGMIVGDAAVLAVSGVAIGIGTAYFATRALTTFLHGVTTTDPVSFGAAALALIAVTIAASCVPAQKAARTDPAAVLRNE